MTIRPVLQVVSPSLSCFILRESGFSDKQLWDQFYYCITRLTYLTQAPSLKCNWLVYPHTKHGAIQLCGRRQRSKNHLTGCLPARASGLTGDKDKPVGVPYVCDTWIKAGNICRYSKKEGVGAEKIWEYTCKSLKNQGDDSSRGSSQNPSHPVPLGLAQARCDLCNSSPSMTSHQQAFSACVEQPLL